MSPHASVIPHHGKVPAPAKAFPAAEVSFTTEVSSGAEAAPRPPYPAYVTDRVRRLRISSGLSQEEVADQMGIRQQTYSEYERGTSHMHIEEFVSLARIFDVSVDFITGVSNVRGCFPRF
ncbi:MAG: helix-turn-helix transcriptional regulator [Lachnospiraceae bacterium]|nr:helix-turn-helix transcriptional regulator [Lachnospiraceae bacterium]